MLEEISQEIRDAIKLLMFIPCVMLFCFIDFSKFLIKIIKIILHLIVKLLDEIVQLLYEIDRKISNFLFR